VKEKRQLSQFFQPPASRQHFDVWQFQSADKDSGLALPILSKDSARRTGRTRSDVAPGTCHNRRGISIMTNPRNTTNTPAVTRRAAIAGLACVPAVAIPAAAGELHAATPIKAWSDFIASFADIVPDGVRVVIGGSLSHCRVQFLQTFMEPLRPGRPELFPVEWIVASYRLTPEGFVSEGHYPTEARQ
jgi:hypothetical protein